MTKSFFVSTHVEHINNNSQYYAYSPYVREMNLWFKYVDEVTIVAPLISDQHYIINCEYCHPNLNFTKITSVQIKSLSGILKTIIYFPVIFFKIFRGISTSNHIHLRCPGNIGLISSFVQILFPNKIKTVKYAGNWDPKASQPWSYRLQKWILSNTFLSRNIKVLVYGDWPGQSKNIVPFFTASFSETEKYLYNKDFSSSFKFIFVGSLSQGKRPLFAVKLVEALINKGIPVKLDIYGFGVLENQLLEYITTKNLHPFIRLMGNRKLEELKEVYKSSHFLILPSKSEGWPKAVAEAMFFGCIPIATAISCVPYMLDHGKRGVIIESDLDQAVLKVMKYLKNESELYNISKRATVWSREYTLEKFEKEISNLI